MDPESKDAAIYGRQWQAFVVRRAAEKQCRRTQSVRGDIYLRDRAVGTGDCDERFPSYCGRRSNISGAGGVPGYIINPPAQGAEAVLDRYAQMVMDSIKRDGFFIRVPAGKLFYVYVTEDILTGKATVGGSRRFG